MTQTRITVGKNLGNRWAEEGLPISTPLDGAKVAAGVLTDDSLHGTSMYVAGGRAWEIEGSSHHGR